MLDGTHVDGFSDFDSKPEKGERYLKDGVLVRNQKRREIRTAYSRGRPGWTSG